MTARDELAEIERIVLAAICDDDPTGHVPGCGIDERGDCGCLALGGRFREALRVALATHDAEQRREAMAEALREAASQTPWRADWTRGAVQGWLLDRAADLAVDQSGTDPTVSSAEPRTAGQGNSAASGEGRPYCLRCEVPIYQDDQGVWRREATGVARCPRNPAGDGHEPLGKSEANGVSSLEDGCTCGGLAACQQCQERDSAASGESDG